MGHSRHAWGRNTIIWRRHLHYHPWRRRHSYINSISSIHAVLVLTWEYMGNSCHAWRRHTIIWRRHLHYHPWRRRHSNINSISSIHAVLVLTWEYMGHSCHAWRRNTIIRRRHLHYHPRRRHSYISSISYQYLYYLYSLGNTWGTAVMPGGGKLYSGGGISNTITGGGGILISASLVNTCSTCTCLGIHGAQLSCLEEAHYNPEEVSPSPSQEEAFLYQQHLLSIHVVLVLTWEYMGHSCHAWRRHTIIRRRHLQYHHWWRRHSYISISCQYMQYLYLLGNTWEQLSCLEEEHYNPEEVSPLPSQEEAFLYQQHLLSIHVVLVLTWEYMGHSRHAWGRNTIIWRRHLHYHPWRRRHSYIRFSEK